MTKRESLLRQLSAAQFAAWELHVYLDTHTDDQKAAAMYEKHVARFERLKAEFEKAYGPLNTGTGTAAEWLADPWPWEAQGGDC